MRQRDFAVEILGEGFQVDVGRIDVVVDVVEGFAGDVAVGDHHCFQAARLAALQMSMTYSPQMVGSL